jgi:glycosyltransferase involved in cell wall biosynthesis
LLYLFIWSKLINNNLQISLITTTVDENHFHLNKLMMSLEQQTYSNFELIIVNQTGKYVDHQKFNYEIKEIVAEVNGLSKARNLGLQSVEGDIIAFPDDDCFYADNTLEMVVKTFFQSRNVSFVFANHIDPDTKISQNAQFLSESKIINIKNITLSNSITIFVKTHDFASITFDEEMGVGAKYSSAEECDYILQAIKQSKEGIFSSKIQVYHLGFGNYSSTSSQKAFQYSFGLAHYWYKHRKFLGNTKFFFNLFIKPIIGLMFAVLLISHHKIRVRYAKLLAIFIYSYNRVILKNS